MPRQHLKFTTAAILMALLLSLAPHTRGQSVTPVPKLDPDRLIGTYYEIARYPIKREEHCVSNEMVLYALGDKRNAFQIVTSCQSKQDNSEYWNKTGKLGKSANGEIRLGSFWPFAAKYWMLAIAPDYSWALVGSPNRKSLWILSRTPTLAADTFTGIQSQASAEGFNTAKLITITQHPTSTPLVAATQSNTAPASSSQ